MVGMLGRDANGETFRRILREENIRADCVFSCDIPTAVAQIQINDAGENKIVVIPSANLAFGTEDAERARSAIKGSGLAMLQLEMRPEVVYRLVDICAELGVPVMLNPAPAIPLGAELLGKISYLTPNETELEILTGLPTGTKEELFAAADRLLEQGVGHVIATLGSRGAMMHAADCP